MEDTLPVLIKIKPLKGYQIRVKFSDGVQGKVDLSRFLNNRLFRFWKKYSLFKKVAIGSKGELIWNDKIGLDGLEIYLKITGKKSEEVVSK